MAWVVDSCILIDVAEGDARFAQQSAQLLDRRRSTGLLIAPVSYVELSPLFNGDQAAENEFLEQIAVDWTHNWTWPDTTAAHHAWNDYIVRRRGRAIAKRPIADILIGAFATRFDGLLTRNPQDFQRLFPDLKIQAP